MLHGVAGTFWQPLKNKGNLLRHARHENEASRHRAAACGTATLKRLAEAAYEPDAFKSNLTRAEADNRIAALTAKLKLLDGPPRTL